MKRFILICLCLATLAAAAQPPARRRAQEQKQQQQATRTASAYRDFPTAQPMPDDAAWRRDIYRTLDLTRDANAVLYYPTVPQGDRMNLFTYLFRLVLRGTVKAYDYKLDGNEDFSESNRVKGKDILDRYHIFYETQDGRMRVNDADLPSEDVKAFFIKESVYYDQHTATFRTQVTALCPVLRRGDEFGGADTQNPMFWVRYADVAPYLGKLMLMGSNLNNAATLSADDFFTLGVYEGDIYKTTNLQDRILVNEYTTDSTLVKERARIEKQLTDFEDHVWGRDSAALAAAAAEQAATDSLAAEGKRRQRTSRRAATGRRSSTSRSGGEENREAAATKKRQRSSSGGSRSATFSVRRQRH